jgi:hypothetical protein
MKLKAQRPRAYRRLETTVNDGMAPEHARKVAKYELKLLLPQMRRDAADESFSASDRAFMLALARRVEAWQQNRSSLPARLLFGWMRADASPAT